MDARTRSAELQASEGTDIDIRQFALPFRGSRSTKLDGLIDRLHCDAPISVDVALLGCPLPSGQHGAHKILPMPKAGDEDTGEMTEHE